MFRLKGRCLTGVVLATLFIPLILFAQTQKAWVASSNCLQIYDTTGPVKTVNLPRTMYPSSVAISPDNKIAYVSDMYGGDVLVYNADTLQLLTSIPGTNMTSEIAFSPDGSAAYLVLWTGPYPGLKIVDTSTHTVTKYMPEVDGCPYGVAVAPDGSYAYAALGWGWVAMINTATQVLETKIPFDPPGYFWPYSGYPSWGLGVTPNGRYVYVPNQDGEVYVADTVTRSVTAKIPMGCCDGYRTNEVAVSPDGQSVYITRMSWNTVAVIDTATNTVRQNVTGVGYYPFGISLTADGRYAFVASQYDGVHLIDTSTNSVTALGGGGCSGHLSVSTETVVVLDPSAQVAQLTEAVNASPIDKGLKNSLTSKLANVAASIARNSHAACNQLSAFINEVNAQAGKKIPAAQAQEWVAAAARIRDLLGC